MTPIALMDRARAAFEQGAAGCPVHEDPRRCWAGHGRHGRRRHFERALMCAHARAHVHTGTLNTYVHYVHPVRSRRHKEIRGQGVAEEPCPTLSVWGPRPRRGLVPSTFSATRNENVTLGGGDNAGHLKRAGALPATWSNEAFIVEGVS